MNIDTVLNPPTVAQQKAALGVALAVAEAIREAGEIPSGTLYAILMGRMSLDTYQNIIRSLVSAGIGLHPGASTPATVRPNLEGRTARCFCGKTEPSNTKLPFFEYRGPGSRMAKDTCRHCGYAECAHNAAHMAKNVPSNRLTVVEQGKCKGFELLSEGMEFDSYYCLCAGCD